MPYGKFDDALKALAAVNHPGFKQLGLLQEASILAEQGKTKEAVAAYDALSADASVDQSLRDVARIRAITLDLDDTLWPVWPTIERAEGALAGWLAGSLPVGTAAGIGLGAGLDSAIHYVAERR